QAIVVADSSKFGKVSLSRLCGLEEVHAVVTDSGVDSHWKEILENQGVGLVLASGSKSPIADEPDSELDEQLDDE
ncbi:MAG: DeoR/GlpR transcriptional regulator, partial [Pirellulaceae bacterium]|nr:DeoR/GlpR transcriptional regulator [Pirellulaceae bacterium]